MGQGKRGAVVQFGEAPTAWLHGAAAVPCVSVAPTSAIEPELMYREAEIITNMHELFDAFALPGSGLEQSTT